MITSPHLSISIILFNFIELLYGVNTIAILAYILFPTFGRARENVHRPACMNSSIGFIKYTQDYDERFLIMGNEDNAPKLPSFCSPMATRNGRKWAGAMLRVTMHQ